MGCEASDSNIIQIQRQQQTQQNIRSKVNIPSQIHDQSYIKGRQNPEQIMLNLNTSSMTNFQHLPGEQCQYVPYYNYMIKQQQHKKLQYKQITQEQKQIYRQLLLHFNNSHFKFNELQKTCDIVYKLFCLNSHSKYPIWALAMHILIYFGKNATSEQSNNQNFKLEDQISKKLQELTLKYPPSSKNQILLDADKIIDFKIQPLPDLLQGKNYENIQQFSQLVSKLNQQAHRIKPYFQSFLKQIFKHNGIQKSFKAGTKLSKQNYSLIYIKSLIRILQKTFCNYIDYKQFRNNADYNGSYWDYYQLWQNSITNQIKQLYFTQKQQKKVRFQTYDLLRAKCQFKTVDDIIFTIQLFKKAQQQHKIKIIMIKNRLNKGTKDVTLIIKMDNIVCQVQLALVFDSTANEFNHKLYELTRDPSGSIIASMLMMLSDDQQEMEYYRILMTCANNDQIKNCMDYYVMAIQQFLTQNRLFSQIQAFQLQNRKNEQQSKTSINKWGGYYVQHGKKSSMKFQQFQITKYSITGRGVDQAGIFKINGTISKENNVKFVKKYLKKHVIYYSGKLENGNTITGYWGFKQNQRQSQFMIKKY